MTDYIGVDLGVKNIATTSDGEVFSGAEVEGARRRHHTLRQTPRHKASKRSQAGKRPRPIRRLLGRKAGQESRSRPHTNRCISKELVAPATGTRRGIALEDLKGVRERVGGRFGRSRRAKVAGWSFFRLRHFIADEAQPAGAPIAPVDPRDTSRTCAACGHRERENRESQAGFECVNCRHTSHADLDAATNISRGAAQVNGPRASEGAARAAPVQVRSPAP